MNSCPQTSPFFIPGINPTYMCRSEPQMQVVVTFRMTSACRNKWQAKVGERPGFNHVQQTTTILAFPWLASIKMRSTQSSEDVHADDEESYAKFSVVVTSQEMHAQTSQISCD
jgi:hypothetical protein